MSGDVWGSLNEAGHVGQGLGCTRWAGVHAWGIGSTLRRGWACWRGLGMSRGGRGERWHVVKGRVCRWRSSVSLWGLGYAVWPWSAVCTCGGGRGLHWQQGTQMGLLVCRGARWETLGHVQRGQVGVCGTSKHTGAYVWSAGHVSGTLGAWLGHGAHVVVAMMAVLLGGSVHGCRPWLTHVVHRMGRGMWALLRVGLDDSMAKGWGHCMPVVVSLHAGGGVIWRPVWVLMCVHMWGRECRVPV